MSSLAGPLTLVFWALITALLVIMYVIARFYQMTSGQRSHYRWFLLPALLLDAGAVRLATLGAVDGDPLGGALMLGGGLSLCVLCAWLWHLMMGGRR